MFCNITTVKHVFYTMLEPVFWGKVQLVFSFAQPQFSACVELLSVQHIVQ